MSLVKDREKYLTIISMFKEVLRDKKDSISKKLESHIPSPS